MKNINIRKATEKDLEQIISIGESVFPEEYKKNRKKLSRSFIKEKLKDKYDRIYVACVDDKVSGYAIYRAETLSGTHELYQLGVQEESQGEGVGTRLLGESMNQYIKYAEKQKFTLSNIYLTTRSDNHIAQKLYHKFGFVIEGSAGKTFSKHTELVMTRYLKE